MKTAHLSYFIAVSLLSTIPAPADDEFISLKIHTTPIQGDSVLTWLEDHATKKPKAPAENLFILTSKDHSTFMKAFNASSGPQKSEPYLLAIPQATPSESQFIREVIYPSAHNPDGSPQFETILQGIEINVSGSIRNQTLDLMGQISIRELDLPTQKSDRLGRDRWIHPIPTQPHEDSDTAFALGFNTTESIFRSFVPIDHSMILLCRQAEDIDGFLAISIQPDRVSPPKTTAPAREEIPASILAKGPFKDLSRLNIDAFSLSGTMPRNPDRLSLELKSLLSSATVDQHGNPLPHPSVSLLGVFSNDQFQSLKNELQKTPDFSLDHLSKIATKSGATIDFPWLNRNPEVTAVVGKLGYTVDLTVLSDKPANSIPVKLEVSLYKGQWLALGISPKSPGLCPETLFLRISG